METKKYTKPVKRKCSMCNGDVVKYSPEGNFKEKFWYECDGCGLPMRLCSCMKEEVK